MNVLSSVGVGPKVIDPVVLQMWPDGVKLLLAVPLAIFTKTNWLVGQQQPVVLQAPLFSKVPIHLPPRYLID